MIPSRVNKIYCFIGNCSWYSTHAHFHQTHYYGAKHVPHLCYSVSIV